jgi:hypothetical protein
VNWAYYSTQAWAKGGRGHKNKITTNVVHKRKLESDKKG